MARGKKMYIDALKPEINKDWCIIEEEFDIEKNRHYESIFTLGTGYVSTRGSIEEGFLNDDQGMDFDRFPGVVTLEEIPHGKSKWGTYMPVIGARHPFLRIGIVNLPYYLGLIIYADDEKLDLEKSKITNYCRWLNLKTATLYRTFVWETKSGNRINILFKRFMPPELKFVCVQECNIKMLSGSSDIKVTSYVDNNVRTNGFDKYIKKNVEDNGGNVIYSDITTNMDSRTVVASRVINDKTDNFTITKEARRINSTSSFRLDENEEANVKKLSAVIADAYYDKEKLIDKAIETVNKNIEIDAEKLHKDHINAWRKLWDNSDVQIDADDHNGYNSQLAIRMAVYHLLRAKAEDEDRGLICPKCLTSDVYFGAVFWDMEIFILPFYLYTNPKTARTVPMFRYRNLPPAREIAKKMGYRGARYPWNSAFNGAETCPLWEFADHQVHITADVAIGVWHYYLTSNDSEFLFDYGAEVLIETARYWTERVDKIPRKNGYQIYGVMGPDEYKPLTNNNAYTNHTTKYNLEIACETIELLKEKAPDKFKKLSQKINFKESEAKLFSQIANGIHIPIDNSKHIVWQCEDFDSAFASIDIQGLWKDKSKPFGVFVSQEKRFRSKCLKQSDVIVLLALFPESYTQQQKEASFDYYDPITTHDSSNSMCHHMIVAANIGRRETAYESWKRSIDTDFGKYPRSSDGLHGANVGGMWQEVVFGFGGLVNALNTDILTFNPCIPKEFKKLSFKIHWKQNRIKVTITGTELEIENLSNNDIPFMVGKEKYLVRANDKTKVTY